MSSPDDSNVKEQLSKYEVRNMIIFLEKLINIFLIFVFF